VVSAGHMYKVNEVLVSCRLCWIAKNSLHYH
jgi:hypothetical protein